ncbi:MAG: hypothetical protein KGH55_02725 [Nanoarchaeota archaeon]|nr:hypothetical protein [Nanoarchaeota archaeon]
MKTKKRDLALVILTAGILIAGLLVLQNSPIISAQGSTVCAVHSSLGWCQDVDPSLADPNYPTYQTSCSNGPGECAVGTCVNTNQGTCLSSSQAACDPSLGGQFYSTSPDNTPVCQQGCCVIGNEGGSITTKAHCDAMAPLYPGATETFRADVTDQIQCSILGAPTVQGACVYSTGSGKTCKFDTQQDCLNMQKTFSGATFYKNYLCTNKDLTNQGVNCTKTQMTTCFSGQAQVYFVDSCGNQANIYNANEYNDPNYWNYIAGTNGVAYPSPVDVNNINSQNSPKYNGNCDSFNSSTCMAYNRNIDSVQPQYGNYVCRNLNCVSGPFVQQFVSDYGRAPVNGESWCARTDPSNPNAVIFGNNTGLTSNNGGNATLASDLSKSQDLPGGRDFVLGCYNGQVTVEGCADYRNQICEQNQNSNGVYQSLCVLNNWRSCYAQNSSAACEAAGDCQWIVGASILKDPNTYLPYVYNSTTDQLVPRSDSGNLLGQIAPGIFASTSYDSRPGASCVPKYAPGFDASPTASQNSAADATTICSIPNTNCFVNFTRGALASLTGGAVHAEGGAGGWMVQDAHITCLDNDGNLTDATKWMTNFTNLCFSLGDCGVSANYINTSGSNSINDMFKVYGNLSNSTS